MKRKNRLFVNSIIILIAVAYFAGMILGNVSVDSVKMAVVDGSYAQEYAEKHHLGLISKEDVPAELYDRRYETFDYSIVNSKICLETYNGVSTELVIPESIEGKTVSLLGEEFIESLENVNTLYLPSTMETISAEADKSISIVCDDSSVFYLNRNGTGWNVEAKLESEVIDFSLGDIPFTYEINDGFAEITGYTGKDDVIAIPSYINGYPVKIVSMNLVRAVDIVIVPEVVEEISGDSFAVSMSDIFFVEMIFTIIAVLISLIVINILLPRYKKKEEYLLTSPQVVLLVGYVFLQAGFAIVATCVIRFELLVAIVVSLVLLFGTVIALWMAETGRGHVKDVEENVRAKTERMKEIKDISRNLELGIEDSELKKKLVRLSEEIRFSDPVSTDGLMDIEKLIFTNINKIRNEKTELTKEELETLVDSTMKLVGERNIQCKSMK